MTTRNCLMCETPMNQFGQVHQCPKCWNWMTEQTAADIKAYEEVQKEQERKMFFGK